MDNTNSISVLGCGWLGFPLAKSLVNKGYLVKGSTTSNEKSPILFEAGIEPFLVQFPDNCILKPFTEFLNSNILIIAVPPGRNSLKHQSYFGLLDTLTGVLPDSSIKKIIFISSTSVYGEENRIVNELDDPVPDTEAGERMLKAEKIIKKTSVRHIILRFSGLIGPDRHPGKFLAGKTAVANGLAPVNLIHMDDAIGILGKLINDEDAEGIYNATAPHHPTREQFYTLASESLGLEAPMFVPEKTAWKEIQSFRISAELKYNFVVPDLMQWVATQ